MLIIFNKFYLFFYVKLKDILYTTIVFITKKNNKNEKNPI